MKIGLRREIFFLIWNSSNLGCLGDRSHLGGDNDQFRISSDVYYTIKWTDRVEMNDRYVTSFWMYNCISMISDFRTSSLDDLWYCDYREIVVQFNADVADGMPWKFVPTQREVRVKPGESALAFYTAENRSSAPITGVSTYNVTPMKAAVYFNKIQCFCFEEQRLLPGEQIDMPVFFYIDPEFDKDPRMDGINNLILSYTFFKVSEEN
ncbi:cytochrome c oxidase assembly protein COX11, mitochondrial-like [Olea europaea var. sylvestris]|uniref:cytochrome c oxidase assembly protein COX11, mitochondrial-like n=1 Tax=Olea europaea var. sylvestris TaxID=158386 RepID=UPI000C1D4854|nr:cytochrome c oxidase assembly protein COX11, mitochondrial-like [Olea europaea var. sylvestris]